MQAAEPRFETYRAEDAEILVVSFGTTAVFVDRVVDELRAEGVSHRVVPAHHAVAVPAGGLAEATTGSSLQVLVYELNAGQMVDDVRMYADDRSVIRSIGGVSQDDVGHAPGRPAERRRGPHT